MKASYFVFFYVMIFSINGYTHGGRTDSNGCHNNKKQGGYHCHKGPWDGLKFTNKDEGLAYFEKNRCV